MGKDVIIACDFPHAQDCLRFLDQFTEAKPYVKIGMELFFAEGPGIVREIKRRGHAVFLDLKLHDIPNTAEQAMRVLSNLDVAMMEAAVRGLTRPDGTRPLLLAVTQLTSTSEERMRRDLWIDRPIADVVTHYAQNAQRAGLDGVVCSPLESRAVHERCGSSFLTVTPGVRFAEDAAGDQARVTTPQAARELGSDYIVIGRSITGAKNPVAAYRRAVAEFVG